jgi:hypothetical protein
MDATKIDWRAARDLLARRFPERWMPQSKQAGKASEGQELISCTSANMASTTGRLIKAGSY